MPRNPSLPSTASPNERSYLPTISSQSRQAPVDLKYSIILPFISGSESERSSLTSCLPNFPKSGMET
ncbi:Uncharacterised protein [uncultured archaeon]|nr:Uncharacterised protein [uncultured archaeon]